MSRSSGLGGEEKNAVMSAERSFLSDLLSAALRGDGLKVQGLVEEYCKNHSSGKEDVTPRDVLVQFKDGRRRTALHFACQSEPSSEKSEIVETAGEEDIVHQLLLSEWAQRHQILQDSADADGGVVRVKDRDGLTPLMMAACLCDRKPEVALQRIRVLLRAGGRKIALARSKGGATALHYAAAAGATKEVIDELYQSAKVAVNCSAKRGGMPLHWAAAGHNPHSQNTQQHSPLSHTRYLNTIEALLQDCQADVNAKDERGLTPLVVAIAARQDDIATLLVQNNADRSIVLPGNISVYHMAADLDLVKTLDALLEQDRNAPGYNLQDTISHRMCSMKNDQRETPLDLATKEDHIKCVQLLEPWHIADNTTEKNQDNQDQNSHDTQGPHNEEKVQNNLEKEAKDQNKQEESTKEDQDEITTIEKQAIQQAETLLTTINNITANGVTTGTPTLAETVTQEEWDKTEQEAMQHKTNGNQLYQKKQFNEAVEEYTRAMEVLSVQLQKGLVLGSGEGDDGGDDATKVKTVKQDRIHTISVLYSNRSACYARMDQFQKALADATVSRHLRPQWTKARYRVAVAQLGLKRYEEAAVAAWEGVQLDDEQQQQDGGKTDKKDAGSQGKKVKSAAAADHESEELKTLLRQAVDLGKKAHQHSLLMKKKNKTESEEDEVMDLR